MASVQDMMDALQGQAPSTDPDTLAVGQAQQLLAKNPWNPVNWAKNFGESVKNLVDPVYTGKPFNTDDAMGVAASLAGTGTAFAQKGAAGIFGGRLSQTANLDKLAKAQEMEQEGLKQITDQGSPFGAKEDLWKKIHQETGWGRGADTQWRYHIPDNEMSVNSKAFSALSSPDMSISGRAGDLTNHPALYDAYPELKDMATTLQRGEQSGSFMPKVENLPAQMALRGANLAEIRNAGTHELTHGVQNIENFAPGTSADIIQNDALNASRGPVNVTDLGNKSFDAYKRHAGEVEARQNEFLKDVDPSFSKHIQPMTGQDTPAPNQLFRSDWYFNQSPQVRNYVQALTGNNPWTPAQLLGKKLGTTIDQNAVSSGLQSSTPWNKGIPATWTDDNISKAKDILGKGGSYADVGKELGLSRNSVAGAVDRYDLKSLNSAGSKGKTGLPIRKKSSEGASTRQQPSLPKLNLPPAYED